MKKNQLPYETAFMHRFNIHKLAGLLIDDNDLDSIARVYGLPVNTVRKIEASLIKEVASMAKAVVAITGYRKPDTHFKVIAVGDSITSDRKSYMKVINHIWKNDPESRIIDAGISGDTTPIVVNRFYGSVMCHEFDWAIIFLGTNDCRELNDKAHISNVSTEEYRRNMRYFTETLLAKKKKVIHVTIPYPDPKRMVSYFGNANNWTYSRKRIDATNAFLRDLSKEFGTGLADLANAIKKQDREVLDPDGIHMNNEGHMLLARLLLQFFS